PDLRAATVYLGSLDDEVAEALDERRTQLQRAVGSQVRMKRTPRLRFEADPAVSAGRRVEEVLRRISRGPGALPGQTTAGSGSVEPPGDEPDPG
ncbi:MAG TPA: ribosome-binding factor A, partial [Acidimicrobiales bacterium]|nr:ribosome-binding factor A [Acidimicrobiales bacterium]